MHQVGVLRAGSLQGIQQRLMSSRSCYDAAGSMHVVSCETRIQVKRVGAFGHKEGISPMLKALLCRSSSAILPQSASPRPGSCNSLCRARRLAQ